MDLELVRRMKERALARGNFKLGGLAVKLSMDMQKVALQRQRTQHQGERVAVAKQRAAIAQQRLDLQVRKVAAMETGREREKMKAAQPGGLTQEVLEKIETELKLFPPHVMRNGKRVFLNVMPGEEG